jgi:hypothetical protein
VAARRKTKSKRADVIVIGATFAGLTQDHVLALAKEVGVATFPTYDTATADPLRRDRDLDVLGRLHGRRGTLRRARPGECLVISTANPM